jgi:uncharacterized surface protein with fasciclin (FAS1) repeats
MKKSLFYGWSGLVLLLSCCFGSCKKPPSPSFNPINPLQSLINTDTSLSFFHRMILQANDAGLVGNDSVTFLIPTNTAFRAAGYTEAIIDSTPSSLTDRLIRYHYITTRVIPDGNAYTGYPTLLGHTIYGMTDGNHQTWFNVTPVTGDTSMPGNVLVYRLSAPLQPSEDSLDILLANDSSLSFLAEVFRRTHLDSVLFSGNFTLLAPVNSAFMAAGYDSIGAIDLADSNALVQLVKYHALTGDYFTNILMGLTFVPTLLGAPVNISTQGGTLKFSGASNPVPATFLYGNQLAGNTLIVHRIDQILSP